MAHGEIKYIEIPADDPARAKRYYEAVLGWQIDPAPRPDYWTCRSSSGFGGAIGRRGVTAGQTIRDFLEVDTIDSALEASEANGGVTKQPKAEIAGLGWLALVNDSEGNELGLFQSSSRGGPGVVRAIRDE
ncbi:MAG TPA: VOC family protein [Candidatus Limnocylindrales bacterium]|nr:VOC family protein [Candidatus Limnocylindrales bacterium]